jgi:hypothetical protein
MSAIVSSHYDDQSKYGFQIPTRPARVESQLNVEFSLSLRWSVGLWATAIARARSALIDPMPQTTRSCESHLGIYPAKAASDSDNRRIPAHDIISGRVIASKGSAAGLPNQLSLTYPNNMQLDA